jgi:hypothetical protein
MKNLRSTKYFLFLSFLSNFFVTFLNLLLIFLLNFFLKTFVIDVFLTILIWVKEKLDNAISFNTFASNSSSMNDRTIDSSTRKKEITIFLTIDEDISVFTWNEKIIVFIVSFSRDEKSIVFIVFSSWDKNKVSFSQNEEMLKSSIDFYWQKEIMIADCSSK